MKKLWIVGCSITHGIGVNISERWGDLVGNELGLSPIFLTAEGSSIEWAANQILQADISPGDIVLWGLTTPHRFMWYNDEGSVQHILNVYYSNHPGFQHTVDKKHLIYFNTVYKAINYVKQVQNYLNKIHCEYAIGHIMPGLHDHQQLLLDHLLGTPNFFIAYESTPRNIDASTFLNQTKPPNNLYIDVGNDGHHPGVQQHKLYATKFLKEISK